MSEDKPVPQPRKIIDLNQAQRQDEGPQNHARQSYAQTVEAFRDALNASGLGRPDIIADGHIHRFDLPDEKGGKKGGWYIYFPDSNPCPAGAFGAWKHDFSDSWSSKANWELSTQERDQLTEHLRQARIVRDEERRREADEAASKATAILAASPDASDGHPYLKRKQVHALGLKVGDRNTLLVPMFDTSGQVRGLQRITESGEKLFLKGVDPKGHFGWIEGDKATVYIAEGYATGASVHMATGQAVALAFNAGNLELVAKGIKEVFPKSKIIVAGDNDLWTKKQDGTPWNVGAEKASRAAELVGGEVILPSFRDLTGNPTDFNDLHVNEGLEAVRIQTAMITGPVISDWHSCTAFVGDPPEREWLVHGVFPRGQVSLVAAAGGVGKSFMLLALARCTADNDLIKPSHFGGPIQVTGGVVYMAAEDDAIEIHSRLFSLGGPVPGLYAVPLPTAGGSEHFFRAGPDRYPTTTPAWESFVLQVKRIRGLALLVIDPLQPLCALDLNLPEAAQFVCSKLSHLAAELNVAVILSHHFRKTEVNSPEEARQAIRGTAGLVDGVRSVYALWPVSDDGPGGGKEICKKLERVFAHDSVVKGCVVKGNGVKMSGERVFIRESNGVLVDCTSLLPMSPSGLLPKLRDAIAKAAEAGRPYTKSRENGVFERRHELSRELQSITKRSMPGLIDELLQRGEIVLAMAAGAKTVKWLDIPTGDFAAGVGRFAPGFNEVESDT
ncbi:MAG: toprim domain [Desulfovibrionaceae bacterium]|nr:MAG: toprim domain [Desulfovibrionaceae bacterium]